ncbi:MAG: hypothetical protein QGH40_17405 [bacterium]|jgi:hypothetical protein|nr:hypothetical protein [bacterium]
MSWKMITGVCIGGVIGFGVGYVIPFSGGTCPFTCNPYVSTVIGALFGTVSTIN